MRDATKTSTILLPCCRCGAPVVSINVEALRAGGVSGVPLLGGAAGACAACQALGGWGVCPAHALAHAPDRRVYLGLGRLSESEVA